MKSQKTRLPASFVYSDKGTRMLTRIKIEKLFDIFDYDIELKPEGITILTGPNGYGKTTVLRLLKALASGNADFFNKLVFQEIVLDFSTGYSISLKKGQRDELVNVFGKLAAPATTFFVYYISEQRLLHFKGESFYSDDDNLEMIFADTVVKTIDVYAKELCDTLKETLAKSSQIGQVLDASFPRRLFDQEQKISEDTFNQRFDKVKSILKTLAEYGLSGIKEDSHPTYKEENAKALAVYIDDTEQKLSVFADLLKKLALFTGILNERRFTFKRIEVSKENGFKFTTHQGQPLALDDLSSGEQQEVVLLYELLFKVKPGTLVLIDEPELSLHVAWQKQFIDDLLGIIELQKINVIIATHSPQIIGNHWDLTVDLEENFQSQEARCESI